MESNKNRKDAFRRSILPVTIRSPKIVSLPVDVRQKYSCSKYYVKPIVRDAIITVNIVNINISCSHL